MPSWQSSQILRQRYGGGVRTADHMAKSVPMSIGQGMPPAPPNIVAAFTSRSAYTVALVFIDIEDFSITTRDMDSDEILTFVESYYEVVIPEVYRQGGEVEKVMGDGVIAVFGPPFGNGGDEGLLNAERCCANVIRQLQGTNMAVKCALHQGEIIYYPLGVGGYTEATMVGKAITELYRLEAMGKKDAIAFYSGTRYEEMKIESVLSHELRGGGPAKWSVDFDAQVINRSEIEYNQIGYRIYNR